MYVLVSIKLSLLSILLLCHCSNLNTFRKLHLYVISFTRLFVNLLATFFESANLYSLALYSTFSLTNVLAIEGFSFRLLEKSYATVCICAFSYVPFPHAYCCWFRCSINLLEWFCVVHLSHTHTDVIVGFTYK